MSTSLRQCHLTVVALLLGAIGGIEGVPVPPISSGAFQHMADASHPTFVPAEPESSFSAHAFGAALRTDPVKTAQAIWWGGHSGANQNLKKAALDNLNRHVLNKAKDHATQAEAVALANGAHPDSLVKTWHLTDLGIYPQGYHPPQHGHLGGPHGFGGASQHETTSPHFMAHDMYATNLMPHHDAVLRDSGRQAHQYQPEYHSDQSSHSRSYSSSSSPPKLSNSPPHAHLSPELHDLLLDPHWSDALHDPHGLAFEPSFHHALALHTNGGLSNHQHLQQHQYGYQHLASWPTTGGSHHDAIDLDALNHSPTRGGTGAHHSSHATQTGTAQSPIHLD